MNPVIVLKYVQTITANSLQDKTDCSRWQYHISTQYITYIANTVHKITLYFDDRAARYNSLLMTNLMHFFIHLFVTPLYMFRALQCSPSGDRIVLIRHLVWLVCVSDCLVCQSGGNSLLTGIPSSHLHRLITADDVLIQFDLLMVSTVVLETCREV